MTPTEDALAAARVLRAWIDELEENEELRVDVRALIADPERVIDEVDEARGILADPSMPLAREYPDGKLARPPYTPRQVFLLANQKPPTIDHTDPRYEQALREAREQLGRHGKRRCGGQTRSKEVNGRCRGWALPYVDRPRCSNHATNDERYDNNRMKEREERLFHSKLAALGIEVFVESSEK